MEKWKQFRQFVQDSWGELKKTTWPSRTEVYGTTLVVVVTVLVCAFFLWVVDLILNKGMESLFKVTGQ